MWNYLLFYFSFSTLVQQFLSQIKLQQNLQLNESSDQSAHSLWAADEISDIHLICAWVCYLISYLCEAETVCYYMCCSFSYSLILTDRRFYIWHSYLIQECYKFNFICFYLNDHYILYLIKSYMLLDHSTFWFFDF